MGSSRFFIVIALLIIGTVASGQAIFSRVPLDQALEKARRSLPSSGNLTIGSEDSVIPMEREGGLWTVNVEFNDFTQAKLIVDTGATYTTISEDLAFNANMQATPPNQQVNLITAGGKVKAELGIASRIRVGHAGRDNVRVVIHTIPNLPEGTDGLLGLSFFDKFMVRLDHSEQQLHLIPKNS